MINLMLRHFIKKVIIMNPQLTGVMFNYYHVCHRELWLFAHQMQMEHNSDLVYMGKLIGEESYNRNKKEILIDDMIRIDFLDSDGVIHEAKKSNKIENAHEFQLLYYLYLLKQKGILDIRGELNYPKLKRKKPVILTANKEAEINNTIPLIQEVISQPAAPSPKKVPFCRTCSYFEYCWVD